MKDRIEIYLHLLKEIHALIDSLKMELRLHHRCFISNKRNYGFIGDLNRVKADLEKILSYLK